MLVVFYDGECQFCVNRMHKLMMHGHRDKENKLSFEDINDPGLILELYGIEYEEAASEIHAVEINSDLEVVCTWKGLDVIIAVYTLLGLKRAKVMRWPVIYQILKLGYKIVNKVRSYL